MPCSKAQALLSAVACRRMPCVVLMLVAAVLQVFLSRATCCLHMCSSCCKALLFSSKQQARQLQAALWVMAAALPGSSSSCWSGGNSAKRACWLSIRS